MAKKKDAPVEKIKDKKIPKSIDKMIHDDDDVVTLITENNQEIDFIENCWNCISWKLLCYSSAGSAS